MTLLIANKVVNASDGLGVQPVGRASNTVAFEEGLTRRGSAEV